MKKRSIALIIGLMSIALIGVMAMQYYFVRESFHKESKLFDEEVKASLSAVANKIERKEIYDFARQQERENQKKFRADQERLQKNEKLLALQLQYQDSIKILQRLAFLHTQNFNSLRTQLNQQFPAVEINNEFFETYIRRKEYRHLVRVTLQQEFTPDNTIAEFTNIEATRALKPVPAKDDSTRFLIPIFPVNSVVAADFKISTLPPEVNKRILSKATELEGKLQKLRTQKLGGAHTLFDSIAILGGKKSSVVADVARGMELAKRPLAERINGPYSLKLLAKELNERGVNSSFVMEIKDSKSSPAVFQGVYQFGEEDLKEVKNPTLYTARLFQGDQGQSPGELSIYFPNKGGIIAETMGYWLFPTILALLALLIGCFAYTLSIIFKQKKISEMKTDFINNMTHEFKTPVATIMIASESLKDPEISADGKRVSKLANIIYDENVRLGSHIERVLNIARLEKENLKIERVNVHINTIAHAVLESMRLQLEKADGILNVNLEATNDLVIGDELHLSNVMFNLVDNAIKYAKDKPEITFRTFNRGNQIVISVADKGMGMTKDQAEKIFDQFYRIPTGNIHNVKGFGLGLSYVNDIIRRLNGKITVKSEKDKGTQFEVTLPLKNASKEVA
ncbi:sensor histidine kinase [Sphingobacterium lactis]|uniref:histidine kinase n=1 Tax=Sphingobacterium lactis TaxID=797291 RepID=A0A1H6A915_9SPHI|nr:HAMP domain-containing sensor histidine kinase [Sphingobacterium lactis]SEG45229.1 two-component system, OmpR family, phosphate regulon sensor histidine kinase PhoR [Sphingobacterium lactis]